MQASITDTNDIKIFVLYLMKNVNRPLDFTTVSEISVQDGYVNYFDFASCFAELIDNGSISETVIDGEPIYEITERGLVVVNELQSNILNMIREKSLRSALRLLSFKERGSAVYCGFSQVGDDKFILECRITEKAELIMDVKLGVDSKQLLDVMMYNFDNKPEILYKGIIAILTGEVDYLLD